jgi:hypothetical protein
VIRKALVLAVAALLLAVAGGTGRAHAAGGTFRITAGGDQNWGPESGALDRTSSDQLEASGTMVTTEARSGTNGRADYHVASGPGVVRARIDGSFTTPSNLAYPFNPSLQAVSTTELTINAPVDVFVNTTVNVHVDGIIKAPVCGDGPTCGAENVYVSVGPFQRTAEFDTFGGTRANDLGLTLEPVPGGYRVHGDVTSSTIGMRTNTPVPVTLVLAVSGRYGSGPSGTTLGGNFDDPAARYQFSFAPTGPVLNDIPAGYTVSGPSVVNNHWTDPFAPAGPSDTTPPSVTGVPDRQPNFLGWYREPVTIDWQATDNSGSASDPADTVAAQEGKDVVYTSGPSCDGSGNCATGSFTVSLDRTAPTVTCPSPEPVFDLNASSTGAIEPTVVETLSGIVSGSIGFPDVSSVGEKSITFRYDDNAGNTTIVDCHYRVTDLTPPSVTGVPDRQPNFLGWYREPVSIDWRAVDNSGSASDPADTVAAREGKDVVYTSGPSCDGSGHCATGSFTVSLDRTPPAVTCPSPEPVFDLNASSTGAIEPTVVETLSGIVSGSIAFPDVSSVGEKSIRFRYDDNAGNTTIVDCKYLVVDPGADTTPPVVTVPADVTVDATGPTGARVTYAASATDDKDPAPTFACSRASGAVYAIGTTQVICTARDAAGNTAEARFSVHVRGAGEQASRLIDKTLAFLDQPALAPALRSQLQAVVDAFVARRPATACFMLDLYAAAVRLSPSRALTQAERTELIADATRIKAVAGCR